MAITITATQGGSTSNGLQMRVKVLTNVAASQTGAATATQAGSGVHAASITTTITGSMVYGAMTNWTNNTTFTANGNTTLIDNNPDNTNNDAYATCRSASATGSPGSISIGSSAPNSAGGCALLEILPNGTITEDSSGPAAVEITNNTTAATASFTPPGGALLVAMVSSNGSSGTTTMTVSGGSLTWTQLAASNSAGNGYTGVWTAVVPGGGGGGGGAGTQMRQLVQLGRNRLKQRHRALINAGVLADGIQGSTTLSGFTAPVNVQAVPGTFSGQVSFVQQATSSSTFDYGLSTLNVSTNAGDALILVAGWDLSTQATTASMPAVYVNDSSNNEWIHVITTTSSVTGSRSTAWVCVNAEAISWVSVSASTFVSSLAFTLIEIANMPLYYQLDISSSNANTSANTLNVNAGRTITGDISFAVLTTGTTGLTPTTPAGWMPLTTVSSGAGSPNAVEIFPYWQSTAPNTTISTTWNLSQAVPVSGIVFAISGTATAPVQPNPNFPIIRVEMAFGSLPGDPSQIPPTWTDITSRVFNADGETYIQVQLGRQYELSTTEAGEIDLNIDNHDGAFTPGNAASPYYPNVTLGTPIRISAFWNTRWYPLAYGYVERWPQQWPDLPQWTASQMVATDAVAVMSSCTMPSALAGDMLLDAPYVMIPASEQYTTFVNGINPTFTSAEAQGLLAANISRVNQRAAFYVDGTAAENDTGQSTNILGSADSGFGTSNIANAPPANTTVSGPGIIYTDPNLPDPTSTNGVTIELWVTIPEAAPSVSTQPFVFSAFGPPSNYNNGHPSFSVLIDNFSGGSTMTITLADGTTVTSPFLINVNSQQLVFIITNSSLTIYLNGGQQKTVSLTAAQTTAWNALVAGCPNYAYSSGSITAGNFTIFDVAIYPYQLPVQRIVSHYSTGNSGQEGVDATARMAQILSWGNLGFPRSGQILFGGGVEDGIAQGPAYSVGGQTAADGINQLVTNEQGQLASEPTGALHFIHRWALYNQTPVYTFGDANSPAAGEIPSEQSLTFNYDNTYVYNIDQVTQQVGPNNGITVTVADFNSQHEYFTRSALQETISTSSNLDAYDIANWQINKYSQPEFRVDSISVDAAKTPLAFPAVMDIQQGAPVTVTRRPIGGAVISDQYLVQKIQHEIGSFTWKTTFQLSPYFPESNVLELDNVNFNILGDEALG